MNKLAKERLFLVDPFNPTHRKMIEDFEQKIDSNNLSKQLGEIIASFSKEDYLESKKENNEIDENLFIERNNEITDICHIQGEKDIRTGRLSFAPINKKTRKLLSLATSYAMEALDLEEVFVEANPKDKSLLNLLEKQGYENLGEEEGSIIYLKDREEILDRQRMIA